MRPDVVNEHLEEFRSATRGFLAKRTPMSEIRRLMDTDEGYDIEVWRDMSQQLGASALAIPNEYGGQGFGVLEQNVVLEETGRLLSGLPYLSSAVLATNAIFQAGLESARARLLPKLASGEERATVAFTERTWEQGTRAPKTSAFAAGAETWFITGEKSRVLDGATADLVLVTANTQQGPSLFAVEAGASGVERRSLPTFDLTRKLSDITFSYAPAVLISVEGDILKGLQRMQSLGLIALASENLGAAERCLEFTLEYLKVRTAFERVIGSFQTLKHRCADMFIDIQVTRAVIAAAAVAADRKSWDEVAVLARSALVSASEMFTAVTAEAVQMHGAIGFTWEHDVHLYLKRSRSSQYLLGRPIEHGQKVLQGLGL